jgi:formylglycine-generating enzyme required for sulfatase activity
MRLLVLILALVISTAPAAHAEKRVALVIGNAAYKNATRLQNPRNDAQDVAGALQRLGFETILGLDLDEAGMKDKSIDFARAARDADVALVYYSGHAMQFGGSNYLMPVDATLHDQADLRRLSRVDEIVADLKQVKSLRILVLDACRVNPLAEELSRSMELTRGPPVDRGLARIIAARGMIISYATQAGQTAADGQGRNSPYTMAFLKNIETPEEISTIFRHITADVDLATQSNQLPELSLSVVGDFYLKGRPQPSADALSTVPGVLPTSDAAQAWVAAKDTTSPAVLESFIRRYGDSFYADLARARLDELKKSQVAVVAPPTAPTRPPPVSSGPCGSEPATVSLSSRSPQPLSVNEECALKPKDVFRECDNCPEMIVVPPGSFSMGSPTNEEQRFENEGPQHPVTISRAFAVGKFMVTVDQFADFVKATGYDAGSKCQTQEEKYDERSGRSFLKPGFPQTGSNPAVCLNWNDAKAYVQWLAKKTGRAYRLLTEAEWEYAARAGTSTRYFWGDEIGIGNANCAGCGSQWDRKQTAPVGSFKPNAFGLYDMLGNAWQWLEDCKSIDYKGAPVDGSAWTSGDCIGIGHVNRGGSWLAFPWNLRAAARFSLAWGAAVRTCDQGFRVARTLSP